MRSATEKLLFSFFIDISWEVIINNYLMNDTFKHNFRHIHAIDIDLVRRK
jgi:hypothetical protein